jgi:UDP-2,3-diacylglucosamine hydrolase
VRTLLFSDVHLNVARDGRETMDAFTGFLRAIDPEETPRVVVLGDLFDFWFEYRHVVFSGYFDVLRAFARLTDAGTEIHFVCGNHDFWAGRFLRDDLGFIIYPDGATLELDDRRMLLVHGDGINPADRSYRVYKRVARWPWVVGAFRLLHPDWAMAVAQGVSRGSRHMTRADDVSHGPEAEALRAFAREQLARGEADVVVCGHAHFPEITPYPTPDGEGLYINTGDWLHHRSYVVWDGEHFTSHRWEASRD